MCQSAGHPQHLAQTVPINFFFFFDYNLKESKKRKKQRKKKTTKQNKKELAKNPNCFNLIRQDFSQSIFKVWSSSYRNNLFLSSYLQDPSLWAKKLGAVLIKIMSIKNQHWVYWKFTFSQHQSIAETTGFWVTPKWFSETFSWQV